MCACTCWRALVRTGVRVRVCACARERVRVRERACARARVRVRACASMCARACVRVHACACFAAYVHQRYEAFSSKRSPPVTPPKEVVIASFGPCEKNWLSRGSVPMRRSGNRVVQPL